MSELVITGDRMVPVALAELQIPPLAMRTMGFHPIHPDLRMVRLVIPAQSRRLLLVGFAVGTITLLDGDLMNGGIPLTDGLRWDIPTDAPRVTPVTPPRVTVRNTWNLRERTLAGVVLWCQRPNYYGRFE